MKALHATDPDHIGALVYGAYEVIKTSEGLVPSRMPHRQAPFYTHALGRLPLVTSGVHLRFRSNLQTLRLDFDQSATKQDTECVWDIEINGILHSRHKVDCGKNTSLHVEGLPAGSKEVVVYFPANAYLTLKGLASDSPLHPAEADGVRWITHGSSITQCSNAAGPSETWPSLVANSVGWRAMNLGFAGQCKFDPVVARVLSKLPADRISLCFGINTALGSFALRTWIPAIEGFLMTIRDGHPITPLLVISPILSTPRETWDEDPCRIGLQTMRRALREIVEKFRASGDLHMHYLDGLQLLGPGDESTMPDQVHPDPDGIRLLAQRFLQHMPERWKNGQETVQ